jgi:hypothetical protein
MRLELKRLFRVGERVWVRAAGGWRKDFPGVIASLPEPVQTRQGEDFFYCVDFEAPQDDLSEDGPYVRAQILSRYLDRDERRA